MEPNTNSPDPGLNPLPTPVPSPDSQPGGLPQPSPANSQPLPPAPVVVSPDQAATPAWNSVAAEPTSPAAVPGAAETIPVAGSPAPTVVMPSQLGDEPAVPAGIPGQVISGGFDSSASSLQPAQPSPPSSMFNPSATPGLAATELFAASPPVPPAKRRSLKPFLAALLAIVVLAGGSAAAYVGIIVPNKPANVLKTAFINSLQQTQSSSNGTVSVSGGGIAYKATFSSAENSVAKSADFKINLTVSGITFPVEARLVDQNLYIKVGDLSTISDLVGTYIPSAGTMVQSVSGDLSNKWIVVDSTLLDESSGTRCVLNSNWTLSNADVQLLGDQYGKHPFAAIQSTSSSTVEGKPAEKFTLNISNAALNDFGNGVTNLSVLKNLSKCLGGTDMSTPSTDHGHTPLTVWVDKSTKRIVQVAASSNNKDSATTGSATVTLHYGKVSIPAPSNAEPALQVLTELENSAKADPSLLNLLSGGSDSGGSAADPAAGNTTLLQ